MLTTVLGVNPMIQYGPQALGWASHLFQHFFVLLCQFHDSLVPLSLCTCCSLCFEDCIHLSFPHSMPTHSHPLILNSGITSFWRPSFIPLSGLCLSTICSPVICHLSTRYHSELCYPSYLGAKFCCKSLHGTSLKLKSAGIRGGGLGWESQIYSVVG